MKLHKDIILRTQIKQVVAKMPSRIDVASWCNNGLDGNMGVGLRCYGSAVALRKFGHKILSIPKLSSNILIAFQNSL